MSTPAGASQQKSGNARNDPPVTGDHSRTQVVQVHLEELGQHSWLLALLNTATGSYGSAQFRFVARADDAPDDPAHHVAVGATFPMMRAADLNDLTEPNTWLEVARDRLAELDSELTGSGWRRRPDRGPHWWSVRYDRA